MAGTGEGSVLRMDVMSCVFQSGHGRYMCMGVHTCI